MLRLGGGCSDVTPPAGTRVSPGGFTDMRAQGLWWPAMLVQESGYFSSTLL